VSGYINRTAPQRGDDNPFLSRVSGYVNRTAPQRGDDNPFLSRVSGDVNRTAPQREADFSFLFGENNALSSIFPLYAGFCQGKIPKIVQN
jgi:hypothetical protein